MSTAGLYDPRSGWQDMENTPPVAGEYRVLTINTAGMASGHGQALHEALAVTKARLEGRQYIGLTTDDIVGDLLFSAVVSYFALNDIAAQLGARVAEAVEYRRPSFGSLTAKVQPHFLFGVPRTVSFPGLELDITRLESIVVNRANDRVAQVAYPLP